MTAARARAASPGRAVSAGKDLVGLDGLARDDILAILDEAAEMKRRLASAPAGALPDLAGRTVCLLFFEPSTRTMNAFAAAARALSADVMAVSAGGGTSVAKGETFLDTARNLEAVGADVFVIRHESAGAQQRLAPYLRAGVVSGGDGCHEHPTQALLDMFTLREHFTRPGGQGSLDGMHVAIVGDIGHSRVARSNCFGLVACGAKVTLVAPPAWSPRGAESMPRSVRSTAQAYPTWGARVSHSIDDVLPEVDAVMALRIQKERLGRDPGPSPGAYAAEYGLTSARMRLAKDTCVVMHPGPINRGVEITSEVADSPRSLILKQVENGVFVRMAVLARSVRAFDAARRGGVNGGGVKGDGS